MNDFEEYADWYVWAKRNLSTDAGVCHGAAAAALAAIQAGGDRQQAIAAARQSLTSAAHLEVAAGDIRRRTYAEWFDWARRELGGVREQQHAAARAALATLDAGQGANAAMAAARAAFGEPAPPGPAPAAAAAATTPGYASPAAAPGFPTPPGYQPYAAPPPGYAVATAVPPPPAFAGYAGFWRRLAAYVIDYLVQFLVLLVIAVILGVFIGIGIAVAGGQVNSNQVSNDLGLPLQLLAVVMSWLYYTIFEASPWQATPGKLALRIKVTDLNGARIGWGRANARFWSKLLSGLILGIGYLMIAFTQRKQGLHDMIAGTLVVRREP